MSFAEISPIFNTSVQLISGLFVLQGYRRIRRRDIDGHRRSMLTATAFAAVFLVAYVIRWSILGNVPFEGTGWIRPVYYAILASHVILAAFQVPLALLAIRAGLRRADARHRRIVRYLYPIWLYVSATGVIVYLLLYQLT